MRAGLLRPAVPNVSNRISRIASKIIITAGFLGSRVCKEKNTHSVQIWSGMSNMRSVADSHLVGKKIQSFIQHMWGFGEEKLPDGSGAAGVGGAMTCQQHSQIHGVQPWQLWWRSRKTTVWGEMRKCSKQTVSWVSSFRTAADQRCVGVSPRHKQIPQQESYRNFRSTVCCPGGAAASCCSFKIKQETSNIYWQ